MLHFNTLGSFLACFSLLFGFAEHFLPLAHSGDFLELVETKSRAKRRAGIHQKDTKMDSIHLFLFLSSSRPIIFFRTKLSVLFAGTKPGQSRFSPTLSSLRLTISNFIFVIFKEIYFIPINLTWRFNLNQCVCSVQTDLFYMCVFVKLL